MQSDIIERAKAAWNSIADEFNQWDALGLDEQETYVALTAALVDVPAVEPVGYVNADFRKELSCYDCAELVPNDRSTASFKYIPLYARPPLSEGEDSAEVIDWKRVDDAIYSAIGLVKALCSDDIAEVCAEELRYALAATRSGSATIHSDINDDCPGEHQEVLNAIQSHNSGEDE